MRFETPITILVMRTWYHDICCYLTIKSDTGQHSQFLRCLICSLPMPMHPPAPCTCFCFVFVMFSSYDQGLANASTHLALFCTFCFFFLMSSSYDQGLVNGSLHLALFCAFCFFFKCVVHQCQFVSAPYTFLHALLFIFNVYLFAFFLLPFFVFL